MEHELGNSLTLRLFNKDTSLIHRVKKSITKNYCSWTFIKKKWYEQYKYKEEKVMLVDRLTFLNNVYDSLGASRL